MKKSVVRFVVFVLLAASVDAFARAEEDFDGSEIERKVERLLEKRDVGELADELARKKSVSTENLLIRLSVFARAGHRARVHEALLELGKIYRSSGEKFQLYAVARRALSFDDLTAQKIFYEQIAAGGDDQAGGFIGFWREKGDVRELENWLRTRAETSETWWWHWVELKKSLGREGEIADLLEQKIRQAPADFYLIQKYLQIVSGGLDPSLGLEASNSRRRDVSWLMEIEAAETAYGAYELGRLLARGFPQQAVKLFSKSLALPFTEKDRQLFASLAFRFVSIPPVVSNPEKQLRFWTKKELAGAYRKTGQPQLAQPLVEELTTMDTSGIQAENAFELAGAVQASSGFRVVESKILQDEATGENSVQYWIDRISYYQGRKEDEEVWRTFQKALEKFPYQPPDRNANSARLWLLTGLARFGADYREKETAEILRRELKESAAKSDAAYLVHLGRLLDEDEFEDLRDEFFTNTGLLPQILSALPKWRQEEESLINHVMESDQWDAKKREAVWDRLAELARADIAQRGFVMAEAFVWANAEPKAIPFLEDLLKIARENYEGGNNFIRSEITFKLFDAYLAAGDWQKAEKMYLNGYRQNGALGLIAVSAARSGKPSEALRIWKRSANLDRRNLDGLGELAKTEAKPALREFYLQMKKRDPLAAAPDQALKILQ